MSIFMRELEAYIEINLCVKILFLNWVELTFIGRGCINGILS